MKSGRELRRGLTEECHVWVREIRGFPSPLLLYFERSTPPIVGLSVGISFAGSPASPLCMNGT